MNLKNIFGKEHKKPEETKKTKVVELKTFKQVEKMIDKASPSRLQVVVREIEDTMKQVTDVRMQKHRAELAEKYLSTKAVLDKNYEVALGQKQEGIRDSERTIDEQMRYLEHLFEIYQEEKEKEKNAN